MDRGLEPLAVSVLAELAGATEAQVERLVALEASSYRLRRGSPGAPAALA